MLVKRTRLPPASHDFQSSFMTFTIIIYWNTTNHLSPTIISQYEALPTIKKTIMFHAVCYHVLSLPLTIINHHYPNHHQPTIHHHQPPVIPPLRSPGCPTTGSCRSWQCFGQVTLWRSETCGAVIPWVVNCWKMVKLWSNRGELIVNWWLTDGNLMATILDGWCSFQWPMIVNWWLFVGNSG